MTIELLFVCPIQPLKFAQVFPSYLLIGFGYTSWIYIQKFFVIGKYPYGIFDELSTLQEHLFFVGLCLFASAAVFFLLFKIHGWRWRDLSMSAKFN